jgi:hypothetical protein
MAKKKDSTASSALMDAIDHLNHVPLQPVPTSTKKESKVKDKEPAKTQPVSVSSRPIRTDYYRGKTIVKSNHAGHANNAVPHCIHHLQINRYDATHAEVYDEGNGTLHAVIKCHIGKGSIEILYKREVEGRIEHGEA